MVVQRCLALVTVIGVAAAAIWSTSPEVECQGCDAALSQGIMTTAVINTSADSKSTFEKWLCTTEFQTHQQARDAGIGIGVPVYGVPLKLSGTFSDAERSTWKRSHCEQQMSSSEYSTRYSAVLRYVHPEAFKAWSECKRTTSYGVACWLEAPDVENVLFHAKWNPVDGDKGKAPIVTSSSIVGAKNTLGQAILLSANTGIVPSPSVALKRDGKSNVVAVVNTTRGACSAYSARTCNPQYETKWFSTDDSGHPYYQVFQVTTQNRHGRPDIIATGHWSLSNTSGRITRVDYKCEGYPCGWSYNPNGGYAKSVTIQGDGRSFSWARKWDGDPALETYTAYYEVQRTICVSDCDCR